MSLRTIFILLALAVTVSTASLCWFAGMFDACDIQESSEGPFYLVYRKHKGPYDGIKVVLAEVHSYLKYTKHLNADRGFAIFYDAPAQINPDSLHCIGGCLTDSLLSHVEAPYLAKKVDAALAIVGIFPIRSFLSYTTGSFKFSAQLERFSTEHSLKVSGPIMTVYDMPARQIRYIAPVAK
jgi:hypothetical protein